MGTKLHPGPTREWHSKLGTNKNIDIMASDYGFNVATNTPNIIFSDINMRMMMGVSNNQ